MSNENFDKRFEDFKTRLGKHTEQGNVSLQQASWLLTESAKLGFELKEIEKKQESVDLPWDERQALDNRACEIIKVLTELGARMKIEQVRLLESIEVDGQFLKELEELFGESDQLDNP